MTVQVGKAVPKFAAAMTGGGIFRLEDQRGCPVVLYFYAKDNTAGCTREALDFRELHDRLRADGAVVVGVSRDGLKSHDNFRAKHDLPFDLVADTDETLCRLFDVLKPKKLYGREYIGVERSTFLIDGKGVLGREWRKVKTAGHADEVLRAVEELGTVSR